MQSLDGRENGTIKIFEVMSLWHEAQVPPGGGMDQNVDLDLDLDLRSELLESASNGGEWRARRQARCPAKPASLAGAVDCMERARYTRQSGSGGVDCWGGQER